MRPAFRSRQRGFLLNPARFGAAVGGSATGGTVTIDGLYTVHTFTSAGDFVVTGSLLAQVLLVGAAGSGGFSNPNGYFGGGAGAGRFIEISDMAISAGTKPVVIGLNASSRATSFNGVTAPGGGDGGDGFMGPPNAGTNGTDGGSGGGGAGARPGGSAPPLAGVNIPGTGSAGHGNNGGEGTRDDSGWAASGGGADAPGSVLDANGASGGAGKNSSISGTSVTYCRGGQAGGYGAGDGVTVTPAANSGSAGGGGRGLGGAGVDGADGVVVIRYLT